MRKCKIEPLQKFGSLITTGNQELRKSGSKNKSFFECKCDCGKLVWIRSSSLINKDTTSCGCKKGETISKKMKGHTNNLVDLSGCRFGRLTVSNEHKRVSSGKYFVTKWKCICDCKKQTWVQSSSLHNKTTTSCGCYAKQRASEANSIEPGLSAKRNVFSLYKIAAKRRNLSFNLSFDEFIIFCKQNCYYCGSQSLNKCIVEGNNGEFIYNGIDRVDNEKGYSLQNCVTACKICNRAKSIMNKSDFISWIKKASEHIKVNKL